MMPDVLDCGEVANPLAGLGVVVNKIADKAKAGRGSVLSALMQDVEVL